MTTIKVEIELEVRESFDFNNPGMVVTKEEALKNIQRMFMYIGNPESQLLRTGMIVKNISSPDI